jgi:hypothetical protein
MLFWLLLTIQVLQFNRADAKCDNMHCTYALYCIVGCYGFDSWSELNNELSSHNCPIFSSFIQLNPAEPILFNSEFNSSIVNYGNLYICAVSGLNVFPWPTLSTDFNPYFDFAFYFSTVEFYVNPSAYTCNSDRIPANSVSDVSFLSAYINTLIIQYGNNYGSSSQNVCPYVFKNAKLNEIELNFQVDTFLFTSLFRFQEINEKSTVSINSTIPFVEISQSYNIKIDTGLLHPLVFEQITNFIFYGQINSIKVQAFQKFKHS